MECVVRVQCFHVAFLVFWTSFVLVSLAPVSAQAQEISPFSQEGETVLRRQVDDFRNSNAEEDQSENLRQNNNLSFEDEIQQSLEPLLPEEINRERGGQEFSDELFDDRRIGEDRFEARGGDESSDEVRQDRRRRQFEARQQGERSDGRVGARTGLPGDDTQIDEGDIAQLEGRDQQAGQEGEGRRSFEDDFLIAEREMEQEERALEGDGQQGLEEPDQQNQQQVGLTGQGANGARFNQRAVRQLREQGGQQNNRLQRQLPGIAGQAQDQFNQDDNDITGSIRPNAQEDIYAQEGKRLGSFLLFSEITISGLVSDNPTASPDNGPGDEAIEILPRFLLRSDWVRHELAFEGQLTKSYYDELTSENVDAWFLTARGRLDIQNNHFLELEGRIEDAQDDRGDVDDLNTDAELTTFRTMALTALYNYEWNRTTLQLNGSITDYDYEDAVNSLGVVFNNDDQDYLETQGSVRLAYTFHPRLYVYGQTGYEARDYDARVDDNGFQRGSDGYSLEVGGIYDISSRIRFAASIGHQWLNADEARYVDVKEVIYSAALTYHLFDKTTFVISTQRDVEGTDLDGTIGLVETQYSATLTHYFRPHIRMVGQVAFEEEEYPGVDVEQDTFTAELELQYIFNRHVRLLASYEFSDVSTNDVGGDYQENVFRLGLNLRP